MTYTLTCTGCAYTADFDNDNVAMAAAAKHVDASGIHVVTCTRPKHFHPGTKLIVFITNATKRPPTTTFAH